MRRFALLFLLLFSFFSLSAFSQVKHPFTFEDMMKLKRVGEPVPSPDGKWVLFAAVDVDLAANKKTSHIWIVPLNADSHVSQNQGDMGHPTERVLIADQDGDRPRWAPDGKRFAFISTQGGASQVWLARFDSATGTLGTVGRLTDFPTEAGGELWSPDGKNILFTSDVYPECGDDAACNGKKLKEAEKSKAIVFDRLLYRHWNAYKGGKRSHIFVIQTLDEFPYSGDTGRNITTFPRDLTPGDFDSPEFSLGGQDNYAFSPDGQEICYTSNHDKVEAASTNNDLWIVSVNGGAAGSGSVLAKNITADNPASDSTPLYSPDGKYIAYRAQQRPGYESDRFRLMLYERKTGEKKNLTEEFDRWVGTYVWSPDSDAIFFSAEQEGESPIFMTKFDDNGGKPSLVVRGFNDDLAIAKANSGLIFTRMSVERPNEIFREELATDYNLEPARLTNVNGDVFSGVEQSPIISFRFPGAHGDKVEGFLVKPPNFDPSKKYPLKFIIHGGPEVPMGDIWSYRWNAELFAAGGYVVIMINFHGSPGYGQKFIDEINGDWGGAPFEDLMKGLDYAEKTYPFIDKERECALGASYGGFMANWVLGHTDRFKCIVSHDGMFNTVSAWGTTEELWFNNWEFKGTPYTNPEMYEKWNPRNSAKNFKTPTLVIHGQLDYRLDVSEGLQLFDTLQVMGVPSKMLYFPDEGHWVMKPQNSQLWYKTVNDWVDQWIGGGR
jgi:dipeptidyl aminopeptidase/acylaminoacyl peptidase